MLKNLFQKFGKVFLMAFGAVLVGLLLKVTEVYEPQGATQTAIWQYIVLPTIVGLIAMLKRWIQWDETKNTGGR